MELSSYNRALRETCIWGALSDVLYISVDPLQGCTLMTPEYELSLLTLVSTCTCTHTHML